MEYRSGLWKKEAKSGIKYCTGKIKIGTNEYQIRLFNNDKKGNEKAPDFNLIIKSEENVQVAEKSLEKASENKSSIPSDDVFREFGEQIEIDPDDIPF